jgi:hypothetical protein
MTPNPDTLSDVLGRLETCAEHMLCNALNLEGDFEPDEPNADLYRRVVADQKQWHADLLVAISSLRGSGGWRLVPVEPTAEMLSARARLGQEYAEDRQPVSSRYGFQRPMYPAVVREMWFAMIAAAPSLPPPPEKGTR